MVFRLPTHLESFIPPPNAQVPQSRPWRGAIIVSGMRASDRSSNQELRVTAVETDGDNRSDLWPPQFFAQLIHERPILRDIQAWVKRHAPPICTFMPDRLRDPNANTVNQSTFRSLSTMLFESQTVAIAPWGTEMISGAGIIIFPAQNSSALLIGALFLSAPFPDFLVGYPSPSLPLSPPGMQPRHHPQYQQQGAQPSSAYPSSSRHQHHNPHPTSPHRSAPHGGSPLEHSGGHPQDQYRYIMPRTSQSYVLQGSSSDNSTWTIVKDEDEPGYPGFSPTHGNPPYQ
ncbi:hypothetical protein BD779DRAFT_1440712 [Infundibulicybe gibba]|nr:hypothetical protein BD779DRAFT_1440712 [Infundibulicybe gibba]